MILIVEDDALSRIYAAHVVETAGFAVVEASNADEAIRILQSRDDIQIVFNDIDMPGSMNGLALAHAVRERWPAMQILVTSGHRAPASIDLPNGARFLPKPYIDCEAIEVLRELAAQAVPHPAMSPRRVKRNHDEKAGKAMTVFTVDMRP